MTHGSIIGYDINAKMCQISYYNEKTQEPETVDTGIEKENNQIPLVMNYYKETWTYGRQARRMSTVRDSICVEGIWECALGNRKIEVDGQEYEGVQLLADFVKYTLNGFEEIESITFTVPEKNEDIRVLLKGIGQKLGVAKENIYVQDYKESFCHYMFNQPKELWQYEAALFYCDEDVIRAYMLRELKNSSQKSRESFVTVTQISTNLNIFPEGQVRNQIVHLEYITQMLSPIQGQLLLCHILQPFSINRNTSFICPVNTAYNI